MKIRSVIRGVGSYLPSNIVTNEQLSGNLDTSDHWITSRTGILQRHFASDGELTSDLAIAAAKEALKVSSIDPKDIDLFVVATATPDNTFPATAAKLQAALGRPGIPSFDIQAVCSGFIYGLAVVDSFLQTGQAKKAVLVGAETFSRILDMNDRATSVLFGDGAGAVVMTAEEQSGDNDDQGVLSTHIHSDGRHHDLLFVDGGVSSTQDSGFLRMHGREVFKHAVINLASAVNEALSANNITIDDINWLIPHQANKRIILATAQKLGFPIENTIITVDKHANTSAASIPLALDSGIKSNKVKMGDLVLLEAMGGGFTWGSALLRM